MDETPIEETSAKEKGVSPQATELSPEERHALCKEGMQAYAKGDYNTAIAKLEQGVVVADLNWKAQICLGISFYNTWQVSRAERIFSYVIENCPDTEIRGRVHQALDKLAERINSLQQTAPTAQAESVCAVESPEQAAVATDSTADASGNETVLQDTTEPVKLIGQTVFDPAQTPEEKQTLCKSGTQAYFSEDYQTAINDLERGLFDDRTNWKAHFCLGMSYYKVENFPKAESVFGLIMEHCTDNNVLSRAKQAMNTVQQALIPPEAAPLEPEESESAESEDGSESGVARPRKRRRPVEKQQFEWDLKPVELEGLALAEPSKASPLSVAVLGILAIGGIYWLGVNCLPSIYSDMFVRAYSTPPVNVSSFDSLSGLKGEKISIPCANGTSLAGRFFAKPDSKEVVLLCPGTFDDASARKNLAEALIEGGYSVCLYDPRGSGNSTGKRSWDGVVDDGLFAYDFLQGAFNYRPDDIVVYGHSLGSATAITIGKHRGCRAVIVENPFCSVPQLARTKNPVLNIFPDSLCPEPHMDMIHILKEHPPLLVVQSTDPVIPPTESKALFDQAPAPKTLGTSSTPKASILKFLSEV